MDSLKSLLEKLPLMPLLIVYVLYLGYGYYSFQNDPASPLMQKQAQLHQIRNDTTNIQNKLKQAQEFYQTLEARKDELRKLAEQLDEAKGTLSQQFDFSSFMRTVITEAKKLGLVVSSIRPAEVREQEYYEEQAFSLTFHGIYVQFVVFLQRIANLEKIVRIGKATLKPSATSDKNFVQLDGEIELDTYKYKGSKADELANGEPTAPAPAQKKKGGK